MLLLLFQYTHIHKREHNNNLPLAHINKIKMVQQLNLNKYYKIINPFFYTPELTFNKNSGAN